MVHESHVSYTLHQIQILAGEDKAHVDPFRDIKNLLRSIQNISYQHIDTLPGHFR